MVHDQKMFRDVKLRGTRPAKTYMKLAKKYTACADPENISGGGGGWKSMDILNFQEVVRGQFFGIFTNT